MRLAKFFSAKSWMLVMTMTALLATNAPAQIVIVVPARSRLDSLAIKDLQKIFKGQPMESRAENPLQIVEYGPAGDAFYLQLYNANAYAIGKHWLRLIFSGERVLPPRSFSTPDRFLKFLTAHDNAIGFLPAETFASLKSDSVRALVIEGHDYRHPHYPLREKKRHPNK
ncbi:MAG: hypothetical protein ONB53_21870 [candidate division KSB1 bacterium]|nr:hypothetical protein [candidate division KSB1 bacterium]MDZ7300449.1 hypothetical protein [candidate division KSB1 bacterium]MDZ7309340.1 hypothetical protein [candidate division KSB1 bacterium]MDZ7351449.1 hypothetical protein [candidate division KSB1 bacterium]MDZ7355808.1 hypothetical protein [candidate division KSB1 bacterium]